VRKRPNSKSRITRAVAPPTTTTGNGMNTMDPLPDNSRPIDKSTRPRKARATPKTSHLGRGSTASSTALAPASRAL